MLFIGLETMSLGVYAITGFRRTSARSAEGALKYFLLGSFAAALLLFGAALLYAITGHTDFVGIAQGSRATRAELGRGAPSQASRTRSRIFAMVLIVVGPRVQGRRGALPHVDPGRLRGRADLDHRVHERRREGRRLRRLHAHDARGLRRPAQRERHRRAGRRSSRGSRCSR
jgi:hypothetical protein